MLRRFEQGHLDGLCGIYSIINALIHLLQTRSFTDEVARVLFRHLVDSVPKSNRADILLDGMDVFQLEKLCRHASKFMLQECGLTIEVRRPFKDRRFRTVTDFLYEVSKIWAEHYSGVIIGIEWSQQEGHWSVLRGIERNRILLADSDKIKSLSRRSLSVASGERNRICPHETIMFHLRAIDGEAIT
ncbi:hypothetical protein J4G37_04850 [Microvirga sp. 3-52]|nr:hypothetical protein [Microvirga sp. 3-52]